MFFFQICIPYSTFERSNFTFAIPYSTFEGSIFRICIPYSTFDTSIFHLLLRKIPIWPLETRGQPCTEFYHFLIKKVLFSKSPYYSQVCALANLRLVFFADDFLEFEASGWDADFLHCSGGILWPWIGRAPVWKVVFYNGPSTFLPHFGSGTIVKSHFRGR